MAILRMLVCCVTHPKLTEYCVNVNLVLIIILSSSSSVAYEGLVEVSCFG